MTEGKCNMALVAEAAGYTFSHKGCPCSGLPLIYRKESQEGRLELTIYVKRAAWRLTRNHYIIDKGTENVLQEHLQQWD